MKIDLNNVPNKPGVYIWKNKNNKTIYIGKAKQLRKRMTQYFAGSKNSFMTENLVKEITSFDYIITNSEKEALVLEKNLIEKHVPKYNIKLTDNKRYPYLKIKLSDKLYITQSYRVFHGKEKAIYYGPMPAGYHAIELKKFLERIALFDKGILITNQSSSFWQKKFNEIKRIMSLQDKHLLKELKNKMQDSAENMQYELANQYKSVINIFSTFSEDQVVSTIKNKNIDVIGVFQNKNTLVISMLFYRGGNLLSKKDFVISIITTKKDALRQFVVQYYSVNQKPDIIFSNEKIETELKLIVPIKGDNKKIVNIALANAKDNFKNKIIKHKLMETKKNNLLIEINNLFNKEIRRIVMIDNSNYSNTLPTSGIVSYVEGKKQYREYRKYKLEIRDKKADVDYMEQGLTKFFKANTFDIDLLIVDGGMAQIKIAKKIIPDNLIIVGLIKDEKHNTKKMLDENGKKINFKNKDVFNFFKDIQTEVDKYARNYQIKRRKTTLDGKLISIEGIGPKIEKKLMGYFKTYSAVYNASEKELTKVVPQSIARKIKESL